MKLDMRIRNERAAKEKALECVTRYVSIFCPLDAKRYDERKVQRVPSYRGPISDFLPQSVPKQELKATLDRLSLDAWLPAMNELESIASAFTSGVADEQMGVAVIGRTFCGSVANMYDLICMSRQDQVHPHWENAVRHYRIWSPRLSKAELESERMKLDRQIAQMPEGSVKSVGANDLDNV